MIEYKKIPDKNDEVMGIFNPIVRDWFTKKFKRFSEPQLYGVKEIHNKNNVLISAPTGSGKTLTSTLSIINELVDLSEKNELKNEVYCVYINPLKSLSRDIEVNLKEPIKEIQELNKKIKINIASRTGDTSQSEKQKMLRKTPHILITTPESLAILLTSVKFKEKLANVKYLIIDEIHALAENKRGTHLSLSVERLQNLQENKITRIGLSASISPLDKVAEFLVGSENSCMIADVRFNKKMDLKVLSPVKNLINVSHEDLHDKMYSLMDKLIDEHKTTLIFTNTRSATERVIHHLKEKYPKKYTENIGAHHGSLSKTHRQDIENRLRKGELKVVVSSTSLELGIDIGHIDLVICLGSPKSIARTMQRFGRSGHSLHETVKGRIIVLDRDDLIECSVMLKNIIERKIDKIHIPQNCLDVLAQQIYGIAISDRIHIKDLFKLIKKSYSYRNLHYADFMEIINYLSGKYIDLEERHVYAKIWHDEETGMIGKKGKLARVLYMTNIGTIPDESHITVKIKDQIVGTIDEAFLEKLKRGDVFILGGSRYIFRFSRGNVAQVQSTINLPPTVPSWFSDMLPLSFDLSLEIQRFRKLMKERFSRGLKKDEILEFIDRFLYVDELGKNAIYGYFNEQYKYLKEIPNEKELVVEHFNDGFQNYIIFHSLYGRRVNDVLSRSLAYVIGKIQHRDVEVSINDNGFYLSGKDKKIQVMRAFKYLNSNDLRKISEKAIDGSEIFKRRFRHCAARALMILRNYKGKRKLVGRQQVSSMILMSALKRISDDFALLKEARREVLEDLMDIENAKKVIKDIEEGKIKIKEVNTNIPSPFAFNIALQGRVDMLKISDKVEFLKKMHQLVLERIK